ncbi:MAG: NRDE family protein [Burkholderiaceae bacterium]
MCLIAVAWQVHDDYPLIVASNRDEFFARPAAPVDWWPGGRMLAGRDLRAGGTWMGVARNGRFAALTNHRDPSAQRADAPSRGGLVGDFLLDDAAPSSALARIATTSGRYNGFNLLAAQWNSDAAGLWIVSSPGCASPVAIAPGIHGLSNARLDTPWPKVEHAVDATRRAMAESVDLDTLTDRLFGMLDDRRIAVDDRLPDTGIPRDTERALSAAFIRMPGYGTRASTVLVVDRNGSVTFIERRREPDVAVEQRRFVFATQGRDARAIGSLLPI